MKLISVGQFFQTTNIDDGEFVIFGQRDISDMPFENADEIWSQLGVSVSKTGAFIVCHTGESTCGIVLGNVEKSASVNSAVSAGNSQPNIPEVQVNLPQAPSSMNANHVQRTHTFPLNDNLQHIHTVNDHLTTETMSKS